MMVIVKRWMCWRGFTRLGRFNETAEQFNVKDQSARGHRAAVVSAPR